MAPDDDHHDGDSHDQHDDDDQVKNDVDQVKNDVEPKHGMWNMLLGQAKLGDLITCSDILSRTSIFLLQISLFCLLFHASQVCGL